QRPGRAGSPPPGHRRLARVIGGRPPRGGYGGRAAPRGGSRGSSPWASTVIQALPKIVASARTLKDDACTGIAPGEDRALSPDREDRRGRDGRRLSCP